MRTQKQIEANYTELIHAGEGIEINKGKISATGGSGGGVHVVHAVNTEDKDMELDYTWQTIFDWMAAGEPVLLAGIDLVDVNASHAWATVASKLLDNSRYYVLFGEEYNLGCDNPNGYPYDDL